MAQNDLTGLQICEQSEGYADALPDGSCQSYWDNMGCVWTIGLGSTGSDIGQGLIWTRIQATDRLMVSWNAAKAGVLRASPSLADPVNANRLDAITDFAYNEGVGRYQASSMRTYVNQQNWAAAALEFPKWKLAGGKIQNGLVTRRHLDQVLFLTPINSADAPSSPVSSLSNAAVQPSLGTLILAFFRNLFG